MLQFWIVNPKLTNPTTFITELPYLSGSTNSCPIAVHTKPFSTSVFKVLIWILATTTKIRTKGCFTQAHAQRLLTTFTSSYSSEHHIYPEGRVWVTRLSAIHFRGWFIRQVSCYTLLSGFRLPWPPSCCLNESTPFMVSDEREFGHFNPTFGASRIASSAYQKRPTKNFPFKCICSKIKKRTLLTHLKFENRLRMFHP